MKTINLTGAEQKFLDTITRLDLEAIGFSAADQRVAAGLRAKLKDEPMEPAVSHKLTPRVPPAADGPKQIGLAVLRLTPSYRHSDK